MINFALTMLASAIGSVLGIVILYLVAELFDKNKDL